ncbi:hypothetical protein LPH50_08180 [Xylella taiwanensis]|uniref:Uncharacterized protein n=2 Tax=Xylella taiwanensis TaxID=1444770 RepID=Z9JJ92_9GAMM|nr:hypothetical protein [Xylella taiwanensis]EWS78470.1 hypothetical protein AF72_05185 [Xylella taiwanensis]MCD8455922.1 hypothetical protein [Xylella taiwanensis]MCD8458325.1 hypothetical protein [Xylella taiwanensis]MCD8460464.1 hypothetical protein [Xylella taiwanensis]MCD8463478.1 hypothetical protein [Xylella taiwanensis]
MNDNRKEKELEEKLLGLASLADSVIDSIKDDMTPAQLESLRNEVSSMRGQIFSSKEE